MKIKNTIVKMTSIPIAGFPTVLILPEIKKEISKNSTKNKKKDEG